MNELADQVTDLAKKLSMKLDHTDYVAFLETIIDELEIMLDAAKND